jgi:hypothetical protein
VLATAGAGQATKLLPRWFSVAGYVVGVLLIAGVPLAKTGAPQVLLWFLWLLTLGIIALRAARRQSAPVATGYAVSA